MRTHFSSNPVGESSPNPTSLNPKRRNCRRSKQPFILEESPVDTMADQRTMAELLRAPTEGYVEAIIVPPILAEHFELKHSLINMMTSDQFFRLENDNPHDHICCKSANKSSDYPKLLKALLSNKEKVLELANTPLKENCSAVILKKLSKKLGVPMKFLILYGFSELMCKALADLDLPPPHPLSGSTTSSSSNQLLEGFADELALITFPPGNDDLNFEIEFDLREREYLLNHVPTKEIDSNFEDSIDEDNFVNANDNLFDTMPEMFTDEHTLDYSSPSLYDDFDDDIFELESDNYGVYDDTFNSKDDKNKSKLLIDELDLLRSSDFLPSLEYDSFLFEDFSKVDALPSTDNEDKNISNASLILEDFDPPLYELSFHKEVPRSKTLPLFSSKNKEKVFKPEILTSKGVHTSLLSELSRRGSKAFILIKIFESLVEIFPCSYGEDICILDVPCLHIYPP
uniref:Reverse transcriptase domain-containing protein n=1 Tax=Tanacetum cinerariifolium TaxID=118510 RepID=A0A6L2KFU6_TANCI|nr:reverse transcriptase domain-containing protein [Tanacetum cinerariifolium]